MERVGVQDGLDHDQGLSQVFYIQHVSAMTAMWRSMTFAIAPQLIHSELTVVTVPTSLIIVTVKGQSRPSLQRAT